MTSFRDVLVDRQSTHLRLLTWASVVVLLALHVFLSLDASARMSPTYDEGVYVTGGYSYWAFHDFRLQPENGMLPQRYIALPVYLSSGFHFPKLDSPAWRESELWTISDEFLYRVGNDLDAILIRGRAAVALVGAFCLPARLLVVKGTFRHGGRIALSDALFVVSDDVGEFRPDDIGHDGDVVPGPELPLVVEKPACHFVSQCRSWLFERDGPVPLEVLGRGNHSRGRADGRCSLGFGATDETCRSSWCRLQPFVASGQGFGNRVHL